MVPQTLDPCLEAVRHGIGRQMQINLEHYQESKRDNDNIYFMTVPQPTDINEAEGDFCLSLIVHFLKRGAHLTLKLFVVSQISYFRCKAFGPGRLSSSVNPGTFFGNS